MLVGSLFETVRYTIPIGCSRWAFQSLMKGIDLSIGFTHGPPKVFLAFYIYFLEHFVSAKEPNPTIRADPTDPMKRDFAAAEWLSVSHLAQSQLFWRFSPTFLIDPYPDFFGEMKKKRKIRILVLGLNLEKDCRYCRILEGLDHQAWFWKGRFNWSI